MKTKLSLLLLAAFCFTCVQQVGAVTLEEIAGVYSGKRTETYQDRVLRFNEFVIIEADGLVTSYIEFNGEYLLASSGTIDLQEDGTFGEEGALGELSLRGRHLTVRVVFGPPVYPLDVVVAFQGHRTSKGLPLPFVATSEDFHQSGNEPWFPLD